MTASVLIPSLKGSGLQTDPPSTTFHQQLSSYNETTMDSTETIEPIKLKFDSLETTENVNFQNLLQQMGEIASKMTEQGSKIIQLSSKITEQNSKIAELGSKIAELGSKIKEQSSNMSELDSKILNQESLNLKQGKEISTLKESLNNIKAVTDNFIRSQDHNQTVMAFTDMKKRMDLEMINQELRTSKIAAKQTELEAKSKQCNEEIINQMQDTKKQQNETYLRLKILEDLISEKSNVTTNLQSANTEGNQQLVQDMIGEANQNRDDTKEALKQLDEKMQLQMKKIDVLSKLLNKSKFFVIF